MEGLDPGRRTAPGESGYVFRVYGPCHVPDRIGQDLSARHGGEVYDVVRPFASETMVRVFGETWVGILVLRKETARDAKVSPGREFEAKPHGGILDVVAGLDSFDQVIAYLSECSLSCLVGEFICGFLGESKGARRPFPGFLSIRLIYSLFCSIFRLFSAWSGAGSGLFSRWVSAWPK